MSAPRHGNPTAPSSSSSSTPNIPVQALEALVSVNSLFAMGVFVGLVVTAPGPQSIETRSFCIADTNLRKQLLIYEVVSFAFFFFSTFVAHGIKLAIYTLNSKDGEGTFGAHINIKCLRFGMVFSMIASALGCLVLMLSLSNIVQIGLGSLSCGSEATVAI